MFPGSAPDRRVERDNNRLSASGRAIRRTVQTGNPSYALRRARNIAVGRTAARAEQMAHGCQVDPGGQQERPVEVPQVVPADDGQSRPDECPPAERQGYR